MVINSTETLNWSLLNVSSIKTTEDNGNVNLITVKSHLGKHMRSGDIFFGYDMSKININEELDNIMVKADSIPDVVLVKKKYVKKENEKRIWKLKHIDMEKDVEMAAYKKKNALTADEHAEQYEQFKYDLETDKDLRKNVNLYKDDAAIKELEGKLKNLTVKEKPEEEEEDIEVKVEELLEDLNLGDDEVKKKDSVDLTVPKEETEEKVQEKEAVSKEKEKTNRKKGSNRESSRR